VIYDRQSGAEEKIVKTIGGLKSNIVSAVVRDVAGRLWIGTAENGVSVLDAGGNWDFHSTQHLDLLGDQVTDMVTSGQWTAVATNGGLSLFFDGEFSTFFDGSDWNDPECSRVTGVASDGEKVLIGAECGLFEYDLTGQTWETVLLDPGDYRIDHDERDLFWVVNSTDSTVYTYDGSGLATVSKTFLKGNLLTDISVSDSSVWLVTSGGPKEFDFEFQQWKSETGGLDRGLWMSEPIIVQSDGLPLLATYLGLGVFDGDARTWTIETFSGPAGSYVQDLEIDADGMVWCATGQRGVVADDVSIGILTYDGTGWGRIAAPAVPNNNVYCLAPSPVERSMWVGIWDILEGDLLRYDLDNGQWTSYLDILQTRVISDVYVDDGGTVVFGQYWRTDASGVGYLGIMCGDDGVIQYSNTSDPGCLESATITSIGPGPDGSYLVGEFLQPVAEMINPGSSCIDKGDDDCEVWSSGDGLAGGVGYVSEVDDFGVVWFGTSGGLSSYDGIWHKVLTTAGAVWDVEIDAAGNKWVATDAGLFVLKGFGTTWDNFSDDFDRYDSSNSPLGDTPVKALAFNADGALWIGTAGGGIHRFTPPRTESGTKVWVDVYPNPYVESRHTEIKFAGAMPGSRIAVYTVVGELVAEFNAQSAWSREEMDERDIASGVYVYRAVALDGREFIGRLVIIR
jgi:ligand-binding sensor domain-containing protein